MATTSIRDCRVALKEALEGLGVTAYDYMPTNPQLPCAVVSPPSVDYDNTLAGHPTLTFSIVIGVPDFDFKGAQYLMDDLLSVPGIPTALQNYEPATPPWVNGPMVTEATEPQRVQSQDGKTWLETVINVIVNNTDTF